MPIRAHDGPTERCLGCGALVPEIESATHRYLAAAPGCWEVYGRVLAKEYSRRAYWAVHALTVDAYAVQHPGTPSAQTIQSAAVHLIGLCTILERGGSLEAGSRVKAIAKTRLKGEFEWLEPPNSAGGFTVMEVSAARDAAEHVDLVETWARSAWAAWSAHHDTIRAWLDLLSDSNGGKDHG